jgi:hypothetical protein
MDLITLFKKAIQALKSEGSIFAVGGGFAASLYRAQFRVTNDIDLLIYAEDDSLDRAQAIIKGVGLKSGIVRKADLEGGSAFAIKNKSTEPQIVVGRREKDAPGMPGLDFLLPALPWQQRALERAQSNLKDFGFGALPCITVEDVIIAKLYALKNRPDRFKDLDDLQSIFSVNHRLDLAYLGGMMTELSLSLPSGIEKNAPSALGKISKVVRKGRKHTQNEFPPKKK